MSNEHVLQLRCYANQITEAHFKAPPREKGILWEETQPAPNWEIIEKFHGLAKNSFDTGKNSLLKGYLEFCEELLEA